MCFMQYFLHPVCPMFCTTGLFLYSLKNIRKPLCFFMFSGGIKSYFHGFSATAMTYPEIFWRYHFYLKSLVLMSREAPHFLHNTSILLEKALKAPSHFKFEQAFVFLLFIFLGAIVWVLIPHPHYHNSAGYVAVPENGTRTQSLIDFQNSILIAKRF